MDPEKYYLDLTSGDPGRIAQLVADAAASSRSVDADARAIVDAASKPLQVWWGGLARKMFETQGLEAYLSAAMASFRLHRGSVALDVVADGYRTTCTSADEAIQVWRDRPKDLPPFSETLYRLTVVGRLRVIEGLYSVVLSRAVRALRKVDDEIDEWVGRGAVLDYVFYLDQDALPGARIPDSGINGIPGGWTQQGLAYDPATGQYLVTSYDPREGETDGSRLSIMGADGTPLHTVDLGGAPGSSAPGADHQPNHSGGVAVQGDRVLVTSTEDAGSFVYVYRRSDLEAAGEGGHVEAIDKIRAPASSYATVGPNGELYLGKTDGALYQVELKDGEYQATQSWHAPDNANGVVVQEGGVFTFAVQSGRDERGQLVTVDSGDDGGISQSDLDGARTHDVGNMVQNLAIVDGRIVSISEAGASQYSPSSTEAAKDWKLWGQTHLGELVNGGAGYDVDPRTMREAAHDLDTASHGIDDDLGRIRALDLPSRVLGDVGGADALAAAATAYFDRVARRLKRSSDSVGVSVTGLLAAEKLYRLSDEDAAHDASRIVDKMV
ncbi:hypothetical protein [Nocardioides sp.]|uniref:hypothetical protein n=1 Tax=Nocardioides sp. TaxID=35761 RepID=UPI002724D973|nr:hypothetical protein [Nocardioides sp.]MDO9456743.1 hypothetical protein [Nocardioides sp.]